MVDEQRYPNLCAHFDNMGGNVCCNCGMQGNAHPRSDYQKPTLPDWSHSQDRVDWLDQLRTNAITANNGSLARECEKTINVITGLVMNLYHAGPRG